MVADDEADESMMLVLEAFLEALSGVGVASSADARGDNS
mgnify:CR=1 FL=1